MNEESKDVNVFLDLLPNQLRNDQTRERFRKILWDQFKMSLSDSVERVWDLPPLILKLQGDYLVLLIETRNLYVAGSFYSCVAMCGIVGERLIKDLFRNSIIIRKNGSTNTPPSTAFDQLERVGNGKLKCT